MTPTYFKSPTEFRKWLEKNHDTAQEVLVGFYKKGSESKGITYQEALDEALCLGWIDGVRKRVDDERFTIRFTPRKPRGIWSAVNIERVGVLTEQGRMKPSGLAAFEARTEERSKVYAYEQAKYAFDEVSEKAFKTHKKAWAFFQEQAPWAKRNGTWWVVSAKKAETRAKRLATLIEVCEQGMPLAEFLRLPRRSTKP